jgi:hypothetical protein
MRPHTVVTAVDETLELFFLRPSLSTVVPWRTPSLRLAVVVTGLPQPVRETDR